MTDDEQHGPTDGATPPSPPSPEAPTPPPGFGGPPTGFGTAPPGFGSAPPPGFGTAPPGLGAASPPGFGVGSPPPGVPPLPPNVPTVMAPPAPRLPAPSAPKRSKLPFVLLGLLALGAVVAGVLALTGGDDGGTTGTPEGAVEAFATATTDADADGFCDALSDAARKAVVEARGLPCTDYVGPRLALVQVFDPGEPEILESTVDGDRATVTYRWGSDDEDELELVREDGRWRIDGPLEALIDPADADAADVGREVEGTSQACVTELRTIQTAVEAYFANFAEYPADAQALVDEGYLRDLPTRASVEPDGEVLPSGECA